MQLQEVPAAPRANKPGKRPGKRPVKRRGENPGDPRNREAERMLALVTKSDWVVALDEAGAQVDSRALSKRMADWRQRGRDVVFLVGGPDGLGAPCGERADETLALSKLTLPHGMVRVVLAEQLYRAWTLLSGHPYHRD